MAFRVYRADIVELWKKNKTVCITVSLEVRHKDMSGIVDRGNAFALAPHVPKLANKLGQYIMISKGQVGFVDERIIAFFTKPKECKFERCLPDEVYKYSWGQEIPGGHCMADPTIVARSARQLQRLVIKEHLREVYLPIPGVMNGRLDVDDIREGLDVLKNSSIVKMISNRDIEDENIQMLDLEEEPKEMLNKCSFR
ncbi:MAG: hypothetical protein LBQ36_03245 [Synergistaceae bacterium]|jgi:hypothetical protein|nr:hypothetical protein [Synergistaceae bacterium]